MTSVTLLLDDTSFRHGIAALHKQGKHLAPVMASIGVAASEKVVDGFSLGRDPYGNQWAALAQSTKWGRLRQQKSNFKKNGRLSKRGKRVIRGGFKPLLNTGTHLRNRITSFSDNNSTTIGLDTPWAAAHQFGNPKTNLPARHFLPTTHLPNDWAKDVESAILAHLRSALK